MESNQPQSIQTEEHEKTAVVADQTRNDYDPEIIEVNQQKKAKKRDESWQSDVLERMELLANNNSG